MLHRAGRFELSHIRDEEISLDEWDELPNVNKSWGCDGNLHVSVHQVWTVNDPMLPSTLGG